MASPPVTAETKSFSTYRNRSSFGARPDFLKSPAKPIEINEVSDQDSTGRRKADRRDWKDR
jgi:hypothetical protein